MPPFQHEYQVVVAQFVMCCCLQGLAKSIAWDGEGATCLMEVEVTGAKSDAEARTAAKSVAGSSLVKSAIFGHDPNWGRIAAAAGYSGELRSASCCLSVRHWA